MTFIGILSIVISFYAVYMSSFTGRRQYLFTLPWSVPVTGMVYVAKSINGIVVLISTIMVFVVLYSLSASALWYTPTKKLAVFKSCVIILNCVVFLYYFYQCILMGYLVFFSDGLFLKNILFFSSTLAIVCSVLSVNFFITVFDRYFSQTEKFIIIKCSPIRKNGIIKKRGIKGIQNGIEYNFKADKRAFFLLRNEKRLIMDLKKGFLGGMYVSPKKLFDLSNRREKRITKRIRRRAIAIVLFWIILILAVLKIKLGVNFTLTITNVINNIYNFIS